MKQATLLIAVFYFLIINSVSVADTITVEYADQQRYLLDSLDLTVLTDYDKNLLDSAIQLYHLAKHDTDKLQSLKIISENMYHEVVWPRYNDLMQKLAKDQLDQNNYTSENQRLLLLKYYSSAINNKGWLAQAQGQYEVALEHYQTCRKIQEENGFKGELGTTINNIAIIYEDKGDIDNALSYYNNSYELQESMGNKSGMALVLNNIAIVYTNQGNVEKAIKYYEKSLALKEELDDKGSIAVSYNNLGHVHANLDDYELAGSYYQKAYELYSEVGDKKGMAISLNNIGVYYREKEELEKTMEYYLKSLVLREEISDKRGITHSMINLGAINQVLGDNAPAEQAVYKDSMYATSINYYLKGQELSKELGDKLLLCKSSISLATLQLVIGNVTGALNNGQTAMELARDLGYPERISEAARVLSDGYRKERKFEEALLMQDVFFHMRDSIKNEANEKAALRMETKYIFEKAQYVKEQQELADAKRVEDAESRRNNLQYSGILIFLVVLGGGLIGLGRLSIPVRMAEGLIFFTFLLFFEFTLVLLDPYIEAYSSGAPVIKLAFNAVLAALIFPLHSFFEEKVKSRIVK